MRHTGGGDLSSLRRHSTLCILTLDIDRNTFSVTCSYIAKCEHHTHNHFVLRMHTLRSAIETAQRECNGSPGAATNLLLRKTSVCKVESPIWRCDSVRYAASINVTCTPCFTEIKSVNFLKQWLNAAFRTGRGGRRNQRSYMCTIGGIHNGTSLAEGMHLGRSFSGWHSRMQKVRQERAHSRESQLFAYLYQVVRP